MLNAQSRFAADIAIFFGAALSNAGGADNIPGKILEVDSNACLTFERRHFLTDTCDFALSLRYLSKDVPCYF